MYKSLNRYNLRHNNCIIFSTFPYFKYSFLSNSFIYKFVLAIIFLLIERKAISCLSVELPKNVPLLELLNHFIKSSTVAYKRVAYIKNLVYVYLINILKWKTDYNKNDGNISSETRYYFYVFLFELLWWKPYRENPNCREKTNITFLI